MKVIILAAGEGTRTKKLFGDTPKALIPVKGRPMIEHLVKQYKGFDILVNVRAQDADKFKYLKLPLLIEKRPLGNAGAVKYFSKELGDAFIATHVDVYTDLDPGRLVEAHKGCATMAVKDFSEAKSFGVVTHEDNLVTGFTRRRLINCGIYSFSGEVIDYIGDGFQDFDKDLFPRLIKEKKLYFYEHKGMWEDVGTEAYWKSKRQ
ncbi:nucleotidyltransferase family protein [Omnitrophica bacterium]|nr:nucleotidyltransferase family protein [Candidatus Omnitrophota bacterium]